MALIHNTNSIVTNGLVLALDAANIKSYSGSGATTWTDLSGNGNNATLTGSPTYNSLYSGSIVFDGSSQYGTVSNNITSGTGDFAVSIWVYKTEIVANRYVWDFGSNGAVLASGTSNGPGFRYYNPTIGTGSPLYTSGPIHNINTWYNIVISRISGTTYFYSNGSLIVSAADSGNIGSWGTTLTVGGYGGGGYYHQGNISNFLVYKNKGLTAAEVAQNYNALKGRYVTITPNIVTSGLVLNLDAGNTASYSGTGNTWTDLSGNGNTGTLQGSPSYNAANGGSLIFDGVDDYVNVGSLGSQFSNFTVEIWFKSDSVTNYRNPIDCNWLIENGSYSNLGPRLEQNSAGNLNWVVGSSSDVYSFVTLVPSGLSSIPYHHAVITKTSSTNFNGYYNGNYTSSSSFSGWAGSMLNVNIGRGFSPSGERWFIGKIPSVKIYNRALSAAEVAQNYNALRGRYGI